MKKRPKLVCFGYSFPPTSSPEAIVSAKRTIGITDWDISFFSYNFGKIETDLIKHIFDKYYKIKHFHLPIWAKWLPRRILSKLNMSPDWLVLLTTLTVKNLKSENIEQADVFMTCSQSHSAHLVGLGIKERYPNIPWIAHFSDPWADNPYETAKRQVKSKPLEQKVFEKADLLIFTSQETLSLVQKSYAKHIVEKMRVLPHAYDQDFYPEVKVESSSYMVIRHLGGLYGKRSPVPFFKALKQLYHVFPELFDRFIFEFIGPIDLQFQKEIDRLLLPSNLVRFIPKVSYRESLGLMKSADALLMIDAPAEHSIFLPSKLIDYIGAAKPIIAFTPVGTAHKLVTEYGGYCCSPDDEIKIQDTLSAFMKLLSQKNIKINQSIRSQFTTENIGILLKSYLDGVKL